MLLSGVSLPLRSTQPFLLFHYLACFAICSLGVQGNRYFCHISSTTSTRHNFVNTVLYRTLCLHRHKDNEFAREFWCPSYWTTATRSISIPRLRKNNAVDVCDNFLYYTKHNFLVLHQTSVSYPKNIFKVPDTHAFWIPSDFSIPPHHPLPYCQYET